MWPHQVLATQAQRPKTARSAVTGFGIEFRPFLHSQLWEEKNGMHLSILSALARLDLDPWDEAATLAQLPRETASRRLSELLRRLPGAPAGAMEDEPVYTRALNLLPVIRKVPAAPSAVTSTAKSQARWRLMIDLAFIAAMLASLALSVTQTSRQRGAPARPSPAALAPRSAPLAP